MHRRGQPHHTPVRQVSVKARKFVLPDVRFDGVSALVDRSKRRRALYRENDGTLLTNSRLSLRPQLTGGPEALSREGKLTNLEAWRQPWQALRRIRQQ